MVYRAFEDNHHKRAFSNTHEPNFLVKYFIFFLKIIRSVQIRYLQDQIEFLIDYEFEIELNQI